MTPQSKRSPEFSDLKLTVAQTRARSYFFADRVNQYRRLYKGANPTYREARILFKDASILASHYTPPSRPTSVAVAEPSF